MKKLLTYILSMIVILPTSIASIAFIADQLNDSDLDNNTYTLQEEDSEEEVEVDSEEDMFVHTFHLEICSLEESLKTILSNFIFNTSEPTIKVLVPPPENTRV